MTPYLCFFFPVLEYQVPLPLLDDLLHEVEGAPRQSRAQTGVPWLW